jgi:hypothetical protein
VKLTRNLELWMEREREEEERERREGKKRVSQR